MTMTKPLTPRDPSHPSPATSTYPGDARGSLGQIVGPMHGIPGTLGTVIREDYNPDTNTTRLGITYGIIPLEQP